MKVGFKNDISMYCDISSDPSIDRRSLGLRMISLCTVISLLIQV